MKIKSCLIPAVVLASVACTNQACRRQSEAAPLRPAEFVQQLTAIPAESKGPLTPGTAVERAVRNAKKGPAYTRKFDLSGLPKYAPEQQVTGTIRLWGNNYIGDSGLSNRWRDDFLKYHPGAKLEMVLPTAAIAIPALYFGLADIGMTHEPHFYDFLAHLRILGYEPTGFSAVTGSLDEGGWMNTMVMAVHKDNPLTRITMKQLDGVFGSARAGGWVGATWHLEFARGSDQDIRRWGHLGLTGRWVDQPINTYGYSIRYATALEFSSRVLKSSDKWNENKLAFGNAKRPDGTTYLQADQILDHLRKDPLGIAYVRYSRNFPSDVKALALAKDEKGPFVHASLESVQDRSYPLWGEMQFWVSIKPGTKIDPKVKEFLRYILSQEGQSLVQEDGKYLPLTAEVVREQLQKLE
ncbi:MAG: hypothetical protein PHQ04_01210 [Opitutaceae bacterium]|nr:hypothetical protein [Opitutaceae bacterium]